MTAMKKKVAVFVVKTSASLKKGIHGIVNFPLSRFVFLSNASLGYKKNGFDPFRLEVSQLFKSFGISSPMTFLLWLSLHAIPTRPFLTGLCPGQTCTHPPLHFASATYFISLTINQFYKEI